MAALSPRVTPAMVPTSRLPSSGLESPERTQSLALIVDDPDAPMGTWTHWLLWNIPARATLLSEDVPKVETLDNKARQGINDFQRIGYGGPCPPPGNPTAISSSSMHSTPASTSNPAPPNPNSSSPSQPTSSPNPKSGAPTGGCRNRSFRRTEEVKRVDVLSG